MQLLPTFFILLGLGIWSVLLFDPSALQDGGRLIISGGLIFIAGGILALNYGGESVFIIWDTDCRQLTFNSTSGAIAAYPFSTLSDVERYEYTVQEKTRYGQPIELTHYGIFVLKKDGRVFSVSSGFESEQLANAEIERIREMVNGAGSSVLKSPASVKSSDFTFSSAVSVMEKGRVHQWQWSTELNLAKFLATAAIFGAISANIIGSVSAGESSKFLLILIPIIVYCLFPGLKSFLKNRGLEKRITIDEQRLLSETLRNGEVVHVEQLEISTVNSVVAINKVLAFFETPKDWSMPLLTVDLHALLEVDRFCLDNHVSAIIAEKTGVSPDTI